MTSNCKKLVKYTFKNIYLQKQLFKMLTTGLKMGFKNIHDMARFVYKSCLLACTL